MTNLLKRYSQKLRSIILLHFKLMTFRFAYGGTMNPLIFMSSGFLDVTYPLDLAHWIGPGVPVPLSRCLERVHFDFTKGSQKGAMAWP